MTGASSAEGHAFISYAREDSSNADRLQEILEAAGVVVWRDTADLWPGQDWRTQIRAAITNDAIVFIACFSQASLDRAVRYQNEELSIAIEQLRQHPPGGQWFIPVRFDDCQVPDYEITQGRTLRSIQCADLFGDDYGQNADRLVQVIRHLLGNDGRRVKQDNDSALGAAGREARASRQGRKVRSPAVLAGGLACVLGALIAAFTLVPALEGLAGGGDSPRHAGRALVVAVEPTFLDDQGYATAMAGRVRPDAPMRRLMTQVGAIGSPRLLSDMRAVGGVDVDLLSLRLIVDGYNRDGVRIVDIRVIHLRRMRPLSGTLFYLLPQAGNATIRMMFDLDEPYPIARQLFHPKCRVISKGDSTYCAEYYDPYPRQPLTAYVFEGDYPGPSFFDNETIHLAKGEQQVFYIRMQATKFYVTFDLEVDYIVGSLGGKIHKIEISDHGRPFQVTGMPLGSRPGTVSYQEAFVSSGNESLCQAADPRLMQVTGPGVIPCQH